MKKIGLTIIPIIIRGNAETHFWPLSRESCPKAYLKIYNPKSLLQNTLIRCQYFLSQPKPSNHVHG